MADFTDVANVLRDTISAAVYPSGTSAAAAVGFGVQVYQGWPLPEKLDADLKAGLGHISVWPTPSEQASPAHFPEWQTLSTSPATLTGTVSAQTVTMGGTVTAGQVAAILADGKAYPYALQAADTLATIATALAAGLTAAGIAATAAGPVVTLANAKKIVVRTGGTGVSIRELRRQVRVFQIGCWANDHSKRDALAVLVDTALGANWRVLLPDGSYGNVAYQGASQHDENQKQLVYRRDILYAVEYATTQTRTDAQVLIETFNTQAATVIAASVPVQTTNF